MRNRRHLWVWGLFLLQAVCAVFFVADAGADLLGWEQADSESESDWLEYLIAAALLLGVIFTGLELREMVLRERRMADQLDIASGAFADLLERQFGDWALTEAERQVALMAIKGYSLAEMAALRATREGTVKAQCSAVYRKAGVSGRLQLLSLFIDDLMSDELIEKGDPAA